MKIYIDESGDLGFTERSSPYFVIAALIVHDPLAIRRCFAKVRRNKLKKKYKELPEFKFNNSGPVIKKRILACIASADVDIAYSVLRKEQVYLHLRSNHQIVYNYLTASLISHIIQRFHDGSRVEITVDKSLNGIQREAFDQYLVYKTFEKNQANDLARSPLKSNTSIQRMNPVSRPPISLQEPCIIITGPMTIRSPVSSMKRSRWHLIISKVRRNELVNPSLLCPIHLKVASSFSGRTYSLMYTYAVQY